MSISDNFVSLGTKSLPCRYVFLIPYKKCHSFVFPCTFFKICKVRMSTWTWCFLVKYFSLSRTLQRIFWCYFHTRFWDYYLSNTNNNHIFPKKQVSPNKKRTQFDLERFVTCSRQSRSVAQPSARFCYFRWLLWCPFQLCCPGTEPAGCWP